MEQIVEEQKEVVQEKEKPAMDRLGNMRKKTDLSDIILEKENSTNDRNKKIVLAAASLVLLFLTFLIITKLLNSDSKQEVAQTNLKKEELIKPEEEKIKAPQKLDETISDTDLKFEEMVKKLREEDAKENENIVKEQTPPTSNQKVASKADENEDIANLDFKNLVMKEDIPQTPKAQPKKELKSQQPKEIKQTPKKPIIITEVKPTPVKKAPPKRLITAAHPGYYVQVGATTSPRVSKSLVQKIRANGYSYITHPVYIKGKKFYKVLIGPYQTKQEALSELFNIKATINPQAFLYRLR